MIDGLEPYPEYKESGVSWFGRIPARWTVCRLKTVLHELDFRSTDGLGTLLSLTRLRGLIPHSDMTDKVPSARTLVGYKQYRPGQIVMNRMQAWSGMFGIGSVAGSVSPDYAIFGISGGHLVKLILERLKAPDLVGQFAIESKGIGSGFNRLYTDRFGSISISLPPLDEQPAIVRFLDHANGHIERTIRAKKKLIALLNEQKQAIVHHAVTRGLDPNVSLKPSGIPWLGDVPEHWEVLRLGRVVDLLTGYPFSSNGFSQNESDFRLLRGINITPSGVRWDAVVRWERRSGDRLDDFALRVGDIVLGMDRPIIGSGVRAATVQESDLPALLLQRVARLRPTPRVDARFLLLLLRGRMFVDYIAPIFTGISVPHLSPEQIKGFKVMLPSPDEQRSLVNFIGSETAPLTAGIHRIEREIALLREYRTRLLADAVTGKLDVREAARHLPAKSEEPSAPILAEDLTDEAELEPAVRDDET